MTACSRAHFKTPGAELGRGKERGGVTSRSGGWVHCSVPGVTSRTVPGAEQGLGGWAHCMVPGVTGMRAPGAEQGLGKGRGGVTSRSGCLQSIVTSFSRHGSNFALIRAVQLDVD